MLVGSPSAACLTTLKAKDVKRYEALDRAAEPATLMQATPAPVSLAAALALPRTPGRSAEVFVDGDLEVRFAAKPTNGPQVPHLKDEIYFVAAGEGRYRGARRTAD